MTLKIYRHIVKPLLKIEMIPTQKARYVGNTEREINLETNESHKTPTVVC